MRLILTIAGLAPEFGGPSSSVPALASALARLSVEVEIITCRWTNGESAFSLPPPPRVKTHIVSRANRTTRWRSGSNEFEALLQACHARGKESAIIHDTGLWLASNHAVARASRRLGLPLVVSPRGMLSGWALHHNGWKKRLAWRLYQRRDLQHAQVLHATSRQEAEEFRAAGLPQPVAVVPNGVEFPPSQDRRDPKEDVRTLLFLSRIHPKKGVLDLVRAWDQARVPGWQVQIAGQDDHGHKAEVEALIRERSLQTSIRFVGSADRARKWELYRDADLFVLPSYSENFGLVVGEALACGVPVITTRTTPWEELRTHRCGWWVETGPAALVGALREATSVTDEERRAMGQRGRQLIEQNYTWSAAAQKMMAVYEWMLERGPKPECVVPTGDGR
jgi:glycosyltransferase involved in cell wall biosynthesis